MFKKLALLLALTAATAIGAATAHATNLRTWVSGAGTDIDNFTCSRAAPCQTFANAVGETTPGGEINCLDPGDFGGVTISNAITIDCEGASNGGIQAAAGTTGITINATGRVNLIGLEIDGENAGGGYGVNITSNAVVNIRNCKIFGFATGLGTGIYFSPTSSGGILVVDNVFLSNNYYGIYQVSTTGSSNMTVRNSNINDNTSGISVIVAGGTHAGATIEQTTLAFNGNIGLETQGAGAVAIIGGSTVVNNNAGVFINGGIVYSAKNNQIYGNNVDGTPLTAYPGGPLN